VSVLRSVVCSKIVELEEELKVVGNNMKSLELSEQEVRATAVHADDLIALQRTAGSVASL